MNRVSDNLLNAWIADAGLDPAIDSNIEALARDLRDSRALCKQLAEALQEAVDRHRATVESEWGSIAASDDNEEFADHLALLAAYREREGK